MKLAFLRLPAISSRTAATLDLAKRIEVALPSGEVRNVGRQHGSFPQLLKIVGLRLNVYLRGPAGSGKTTAVEKVAEALGLPFYCQSMGPQTSQAKLLGYMDATGRFVPGILFRPFTEGGVLCLDEIDNSNPSVLTVLNFALANGYCAFPNGMQAKHKDFVVVAAGNTFGKGADALYVGRQHLDAATLNRFVVLEWGYDGAFERDLAGTDQTCWTEHVQKIRATVERLKLRIVISPRQSIMGATMLRAGMEWAEVEQLVLWGGVGTDDRAKILANLQWLPEGMMHIEHTFESMDAFLKAANGKSEMAPAERASRRKNRHAFTHTNSYSEALTLVRKGWPEGAAMVRALSSDIIAVVGQKVQRPETSYALCGDTIDMGRFLIGEPECFAVWTDSEVEAIGTKIVRIVANYAASAAVSADVLRMRGAAICALAEALEQGGRGARSSQPMRSGAGEAIPTRPAWS